MVASTGLCLAAARFGRAPTVRLQANTSLKLEVRTMLAHFRGALGLHFPHGRPFAGYLPLFLAFAGQGRQGHHEQRPLRCGIGRGDGVAFIVIASLHAAE